MSLHFEELGQRDAPPLLLAHSLGANASVWDPVLPALVRHHRVIRYDLPGHGRSSPRPGPYTMESLSRQALSLLDQLQIARASICGTSLGAMIAMWLAVHEQARVDRIAVVCSSPELSGFADRAQTVRREGLAQVARGSVERWFTPEYAREHPELIERMRALVEATDREGYAACCEAIAGFSITDRLAEVRAPSLVIAGAQDLATPPAHAYAIGAKLPHARVVVIDGAAHLAIHEQADVVADLLAQHFSGRSDGEVGERPKPTTASDRPDPARVGEQVRRAVLGDAHVDRAQASSSELTAPFQDLITRYAWGDVWARPGLERRERSIVALTVLASLGHERELAMHVRAARRNGLTTEQIREVLLQVAIYAGVPAANRAFAVAQQALADSDSESS